MAKQKLIQCYDRIVAGISKIYYKAPLPLTFLVAFKFSFAKIFVHFLCLTF